MLFYDDLGNTLQSEMLDSQDLRLGSNIYRAVATNSYPCKSDTAFITIEVDSDPVVSTAIGEITCFGSADGRIEIVAEPAGLYEFSINDNASTNDPLFDGLSAGTYTITIRNTASGCITESMVELDEGSLISVDLGPDITVGKSELIELEAVANVLRDSLQAINWATFDGTLDSDDLVVSTSFVSENQVSVVITDHNGCMASDTMLVAINEPDITLPNVLSPDSQSGNNVFSFINLDDISLLKEVSIYDRWGNKVYSLQNEKPESMAWDGTKGGSTVAEGVYVYYISYLSKSEEPGQIVGDLTILR